MGRCLFLMEKLVEVRPKYPKFKEPETCSYWSHSMTQPVVKDQATPLSATLKSISTNKVVRAPQDEELLQYQGVSKVGELRNHLKSLETGLEKRSLQVYKG